jgi:hypothetical protein
MDSLSFPWWHGLSIWKEHMTKNVKETIKKYLLLSSVADCQGRLKMLTVWTDNFSNCLQLAAWLPDCLNSWLPDYLADWLPGYLAAWLPDRLADWLRDCLAAWLLGCFAAWLPCCQNPWLPDCMAAWLHDCLVAWIPGCLTTLLAACLTDTTLLADCLAASLSRSLVLKGGGSIFPRVCLWPLGPGGLRSINEKNDREHLCASQSDSHSPLIISGGILHILRIINSRIFLICYICMSF